MSLSGFDGVPPGRLRSLSGELSGDSMLVGRRPSLGRSPLPEYTLNALIAMILLVFFAPIMLLTALIILLTDPGPLLFAHTRIGRDGVKFKCLKFRSMTVNAPQLLEHYLRDNAEARAEWTRDHKLRNDPRVTPWGRFMRKSSLDELPQLFNVLKGEMNLVGPRPIVDDEVRRYRRYFKYYTQTTPGITGLWQVMGRSNTTYRRRVAIDTVYARARSLKLDLWIMVTTVAVVFTRDGSC